MQIVFSVHAILRHAQEGTTTKSITASIGFIYNGNDAKK